MILDGEPEGGVAENSVGIYFAEQEAGFLAGIAAALETKLVSWIHWWNDYSSRTKISDTDL